MPSKLLGVMTGVALLASFGVANARGPVMTDTQLDKVVAGLAVAVATVHNANAAVNFVLIDNAPTSSTAQISGTFTANGPAPNTLSLQAVATVP